MRPSLPRRSRRLSALLMASALLATSLQMASAASPQDRFKATALKPTGTIVGNLDKAARSKDGKVAIIVKLAEDSVASYTGGVSGLAPTSPKATGQSKIDLKASATTKYRDYLKGKQDAFQARLDKVQGSRVTGRFDLVLNGVSAVVAPEDVAAVAAMPGVEAVYPDVLLKLDTDATPSFIGATSAWSSLGGQESAGEGVIVGVLDTGIWPEHPSFSDPDPSGKPYAAPTPAPDGSRACEFSGGLNPGPAFSCNNKLIGADRVMATYDAVIGLGPGEFTSARDDDGHGTHTSSTAAGNAKVSASIFGISRGIVSGIAPRAKVEMFKVCGAQGCFGSDSAAAVQAAIGDGVNVINFSISGGSNPYGDAVELAFLDAYNAGIFVAASAGNAGPGADTTDHRGPWVTTVAASTGPRAFVDTIHLTADGGATLDLAGTSLTTGVGPLPVVVNPDAQCLNNTPAGTFTGQIVVCVRGNNGRAEKGFNVLQRGAAGMILYNQSAGVTDLETDNHFLPASHIQFSQGTTLLSFISGHTNVQATISAGVKGTQQADVMASFSSRGGPGQSLGVSKPDITAPGVQILAGASPQHVGVASGPQGELFQAIAGTSMSSPHIAGSAALVKAMNPTFTAGQIKSALMTTASTKDLVKEDGVTPFDAFDAGSGRVNMAKAGNPGITFDVTGAEYLAHKADLYTANYPSIYHPTMPGVITLTRTAKSVIGSKSQWNLSTKSPSDFKITVPSSISVNAYSATSFDITLDASTVPLGQTRFGTITLKQSNGNRVLHIPVTIVRGQEKIQLTKACAPTNLAVGAKTSCTITATNPTFDDVNFLIEDQVPKQLTLDKSSVVNARVKNGGTLVQQFGTIPGVEPPDVHIAAGPSPAGYIPLSLFPNITPIVGVGDETISNFNVPAFSFAGETWTRFGVVSDGYLVVGGGTGADIQFVNQNLPDPNRPNNVLAPFWTDLNPGASGAIRVGVLTDGVNNWIVVDFDGVREYSSPGKTHQFEIWIGINGTEDISYAYGANTGNGDLGFATVGVENKFGNRGQNRYLNSVGTLPANGDELVVTSTPGTPSTPVVVKYDATAKQAKPWTNCATLESDAFLGISYACVSGTNH